MQKRPNICKNPLRTQLSTQYYRSSGKKEVTILPIITKEKLHELEQNHLFAKSKHSLLSILFGRTTVICLLLLLQLGVLFSFFYFLGDYVPLYFGGTSALVAWMVIYLMNTEDDPTVNLSWCALIAIAPILGFFLYWYIQLDLGHRITQRVLQNTQQESLAYLADQSHIMEHLKKADKPLHDLAYYTSTHGGCQIFDHSTATYYPVGEKKFEAMMAEMEKAEHYIFLEYFALGQGSMWSTILELLLRKAAQGVEIRLLYDGTNELFHLPYNYPQQLEAQGIHCKVYAPLRPMMSTHYNNRDHRKILIVDGHTAFTGGVNLEDKYININPPYGHWKDAGLMVKGDAARGFVMMFLQMWNASEKERDFATYLPQPGQFPQPNSTGYVIPYCDSPLDDERLGETVYLDILNRAEDYVYIMTPYLILDEKMLAALTFAAKRGVDVRILLPHIPDKKYAFALAKRHYKQLIRAGVKLYEYTPGFVHSKIFLSDDRKAVVGTINLDFRSLYLNFECAAYMQDLPVVQDIKTDYLDTLAISQHITMEDACNQKWYTRFAGWLLKTIAPLM